MNNIPMKDKIITLKINDNITLKDIKTENWPYYTYYEDIDESIFNNLSEVTVQFSDNTYKLNHQKIDKFIRKNDCVLFKFKGEYDFKGISGHQIYTIKLNNNIQIDNVIIRMFPYYEVNYIIEKDTLVNGLPNITVINKENNIYKYFLTCKGLCNYRISNGHTLFEFLDKNDDRVKNIKSKYKFKLKNGEVIDINLNDFDKCYEYENIIEENVLKRNISVLEIINDDNVSITYKDQILYNYHIINGHTFFNLRDKTQEDVDNEMMIKIYKKLIDKTEITIDDFPDKFKKEILELNNK